MSVSVALVGATASVLALALTAAGADSASDAPALYSAIRTLVFTLAVPLSLASLATGILLGLGTSWGVLRHGWVVAKLCLQLAIILTGALVVGPSVGSLIDASAVGDPLGAARWTLPLAGACNLAFAITAVGLAVFKPHRRPRPESAARSAPA